MDGIIPLNKERGMTSFDCVRSIRKIVHMKKVGHSGTLDPNVDGVLPICLGSATKVVDFLMDSGKQYQGEITLGFATTTEDLDGEVVAKKALFQPFDDQIVQKTMNQFVSEHLKQIPPMYSAVKVNGRRLYDYARKGETVERPVRYVKVTRFEMIGDSHFDQAEQTQSFRFIVNCGKGTYVRTLAVMLGKALNVPATMTDLTRTKSGHFNLEQTYTLAQIKTAFEEGHLDKMIFPLSHALSQFESFDLNDQQWQIVRNGGFLKHDLFNSAPNQVVLKYHGHVKALYELNHTTNQYRPFKMFSNQ